MHYRFQKKSYDPELRSPHIRRKKLRLKGKDTLRRESIADFYRLQDPEPFSVPFQKRNQKPKRFQKYVQKLRSFFGRRFEKSRLRRTESYRTVPLLFGALCGTFTVTVLSLGIVFLFLAAPYQRRYTLITVPDFQGKDPFSVVGEDEPFNLIIRYENNPDVESGLVIAQSPPGGVVRRLYEKEDYFTVTLTVSQKSEPICLENLIGLSRRDAALHVQNQGLSSEILTEYSDRKAGTVIGTNPPPQTPLNGDETVTLIVSRGNRPSRSYVPELEGLNESEALERLSRSGLTVGNIVYQTSSLPSGTVLSQQYAAHTMVEAETAVDLTVSLGERYEIRTVPDLYGLNTETAEQKLKEYGLTVGNRYPIKNAAPQGTVIAQSPLPDTPLTASAYAVDLYVSS